MPPYTRIVVGLGRCCEVGLCKYSHATSWCVRVRTRVFLPSFTAITANLNSQGGMRCTNGGWGSAVVHPALPCTYTMILKGSSANPPVQRAYHQVRESRLRSGLAVLVCSRSAFASASRCMSRMNHVLRCPQGYYTCPQLGNPCGNATPAAASNSSRFTQRLQLALL